MEEHEDSYISLMLTSKGRYYWGIKLNFNNKETDITVINRIKNLNKQMLEAFPKNTADLTVGNTIRSKSYGLDHSEE